MRVGRQHVRENVITLRPEKNGRNRMSPDAPPLAAWLAAAPSGD